jgi:hypothetical protein
VRVIFAALRQMGLFGYGPATPSPEDDEETLRRPGPKLQDTTHWLRYLHLIEEPASLPGHGWEGVVAWRLDVLLALSELPRSRWRVVAFYADGYERSELAELMGESEPWGEPSVRTVLKEASGHIRRRCELDSPGRLERRRPRPGATPTSQICEVEAEWRRVRSRTREELLALTTRATSAVRQATTRLAA